MIDEKETIEAIEEKILEVKADKEKCEVIFDFADILMAVYRELIYFIDKQPRVGEWIPCSKQLPEMHKVPLDYDEYYMISDSVLVTDGNDVFISEYEQDGDYRFGWFYFGAKCENEITHWMPLPEPCKEDDANE